MRFARKHAVVTGGASGIGRATALRLSDGGAHVLIADVDTECGEALAAAFDGRIGFHRADVTQAEQVEALMHAADAAGGLDIVLNNAGAGGAREPIDRSRPRMGTGRWRCCCGRWRSASAMPHR